MRLIHLSDLHLGKKLNEASLIEDQRYILWQIAEIAKEEKPDAVLIAGDAYDKPVPSAEAVGLLDDFLTLLARRGLPVILISGNHDSAERLAFGARLLTAKDIHISPAFDAAHAQLEPVRLQDAFGTVNVWPVPFIKPAHVRAALPDALAATYTEALGSVIAAMQTDPEERNVLVCHQFVTGAKRSESEDVPVGGLDNVDADVFALFDYVALGHLHRPQHVCRETVRYCGSPLKYSFTEAGDEKSVTLIDLGNKGDVRIRTLPLTPRRDLRELRGLYGELTLQKNYQGTPRDDYLHITLTDEEDQQDA
ncbi:MAG: exonuclease SbcCD subunit D, partial [Eubacteriales bacterium]|nr:exonuclease SbcCD subunit D [Eubacteriales bacterium]